MPREVSERTTMIDRARIVAIRTQAAELLQELDDADLVEAAALLSSTIDSIDSSLCRLDGVPAPLVD